MKDAKVHIYTGDGKGKTTAAFGLCLRAIGHGLKVYVFQFRKGMDSGERVSAERCGLHVTSCGVGRNDPPCSRPCRLLASALFIVEEEAPDIVVLDEVMAALRSGCLRMPEVISILDAASGRTEMVLTGRGAPEELIARADLISSVEAVKHYHALGVKARQGIEF